MQSKGRSTGALLFLGLLLPSVAAAQAWVPPEGEGFLTLTIQSLEADKHLFASPVLGTTELDIGTVEGRTLLLDGDFGITGQLAVTASVAYIDARFTEGGRFEEIDPENPHLHLEGDDGEWHGSFQDVRLSLRYMQPAGEWALTPSVAVVFPLRSYRTFGHAATGRGLEELQLGFDAGRILYLSGRPRAYTQGSYRYAFIEEIADVSMNRSDLFLELGYLAHPRLTVRGFAAFQTSHGGFEGSQSFLLHDQLSASEWVRLGVGVSTPISRGMDLFLSVGQTIEGENTHNATTVSIGTTWGFQAPGFGRTKIRFPEPRD